MSENRGNGRLRVLFITRKWPPAVGGMEVYCVELTSELAKRTELTTHYLPGRKNGQPPGIIAATLFFIRQALFLVRFRKRFDVIHYGDLVLFPLAWLAHRKGRRFRQVISVHGTDIAYGIREGLKPSFYRHFLAFASRNRAAIDVFLANSKATAEHCDRVGLGNTEVVHLGVRTDMRSVIPDRPEDYILFVGRLVRRKGVGWFIREVLPRLPSGLTLKIAGTVWDPDEGAMLDDSRVEFLGPVFGTELSRLRRRSLAVIMPNIPMNGLDFEGFGLTALEAGADGAVLLASALDGIVDAVEDRVTGILVEPENADKWLQAINEVSGWSLDKRAEFLRNAKQRIGDYYNWERVCEETISFYQTGSVS